MRRDAWLRACEVARTGGTIRPTLPNLRAAYLIVNRRVPWGELQGLALE